MKPQRQRQTRPQRRLRPPLLLVESPFCKLRPSISPTLPPSVSISSASFHRLVVVVVLPQTLHQFVVAFQFFIKASSVGRTGIRLRLATNDRLPFNGLALVGPQQIKANRPTDRRTDGRATSRRVGGELRRGLLSGSRWMQRVAGGS